MYTLSMSFGIGLKCSTAMICTYQINLKVTRENDTCSRKIILVMKVEIAAHGITTIKEALRFTSFYWSEASF